MSHTDACIRAPMQVRSFFADLLTLNLLAKISALGLVVASAGFGATYAFQSNLSHSALLAALAVLMAVSLEIAKPLAIARTFDALRSWSFARAAMLAVLGIVAVGYSLTAELSLMARSRADTVSERATLAKRSTDATNAVKRIRAELVTHDASAPVAPIAPAAAPTCSGNWLANSRQRAACIEISKTASDAATTHASAMRDHAKAVADHRNARASLVSRLDNAEQEAGKAGAFIVADAGAVALAAYAAALGVKLDADVLGNFLVLAGVLALEIGSAFAGVLASGGVVVVREAAKVATPVQAAAEVPVIEQIAIAAEPDAVEPVVIGEQIKASPVTRATADQLVKLVASHGEYIAKSKREVARVLDMNSSTVCRALSYAVTAGLLIQSATDAGEIVLRVAV